MKEHLYKQERCKNCYHFSSCAAWVRHGTTLYDDYEYSVEDCTYYIPAADVEEVRHGEWKLLNELQFCDGSYETTCYCSLCEREVTVKHEEWYGAKTVLSNSYPYCHCGAKMDGGK